MDAPFKLLLSMLCLLNGFTTVITKELDWYLLGPIEFGERAVRSGIALVIIGFFLLIPSHYRIGNS
jgi:hypothetical protein